MAHKAEQILDALATVLAGLTTTGANVARARAWPVDTLPALSIEMGPDRLLDDQLVSAINRVLQVALIAQVRQTANLETTLNVIKTEIYAAIMADITLGGLAIEVELVVDEQPEIEAEQDQPTARLTMQWQVFYRHSATSTEV